MSASMEPPSRPPLLDDNDRPGPPPVMSAEPGRSSKGLTLFIAAFALVSFGGIVWYAYDQGRRTGSEETAPLIRADAAPVRVRPEKPGGLSVPHQDKLIFEKLTEGGSKSSRPVEQLLPRPEQPLPAPVAAPSTQTETVPPARKPRTVAERAAPKAPPAAVSSTTSNTSGAPRKLVPPARSTSTIPAAPKPERVPDPPVAAKKKPTPAPKAKAPPKTSGTKKTVQPVPNGRYRIQIAAFKDESAARTAWERVKKANKAELGALGLTIERINITGKGTFHRVQGGPLDEARAREICRILDTRKQACIVVRR
jgi:cell division septation protein DedD